MTLPADFDRAKWLDPLTFQGLIGCVLAQWKVPYEALFREDGFAKPISELRADRRVAKMLDRLQSR